MARSRPQKKHIENNIGAVRRFRGIKQAEAAAALGVGKSTYAHWEQGENDPGSENIAKMREYYRVTADQLLIPGYPLPGEYPEHAHLRRAPIVGRIAAGTPREALCQSDTMHDTPASIYEGRRNAFWLTVSGNSMNRLFPDGSLVLIDPDEEVRNGDVAVVFVNGDDATLKRIYFEGGSVRLHPESYDPEYRDRIIDATDPDAPEVRVIGKAVSYTAPDGWRA